MATGTEVSQIHRRSRWRVLRLLVVVLLVAAAVGAVALLGGKKSDSAADHNGPAEVEHVEGESLSRVTLTPEAAERLGIETVAVRTAAERTSVPYAALIYDPQGETWVYTNPERMVFVRAQVEVDRIEGQLAFLSAGPASGTDVVTVGGAELYGTEFEVGH